MIPYSKPVVHLAERLNAAGISTISLKLDGSKSPDLPTWKQYQTRLPNRVEISQFFGNSPGIAAICGRVSNGMEAIDFDDGSTFAEWCRLVEDEQPGLTAKLSVCQTPRIPAGYHARYRCPGHIEGSQKLALFPDGKTRIETKGEGGYVVVEGSPDDVHQNKTPYTHHSGPPLTELPTVTAEERSVMISKARLFDQSPMEETHRPSMPPNANGDRPGDEFNRSPEVTWESILEPHGWKKIGRAAELDLWQRNGKTGPGHSATTGKRSKDGVELFCVFSSNAHPFPGPSAGKINSSHSKFATFALLNHNGDYSAAARELASQGYGKIASNGERNGTATEEPPNSGTPPEGKEDKPDPLATLEAVPISQLQRVNANREFLWEGYIPRNTITLLSGYWKAGKTTFFVWFILSLIQGVDFLGRKTRLAKVLVITEEDADIWCDRRDALGLTDQVAVIINPFFSRPTTGEWRKFTARITELVKRDGYDIVFLDTIFSLWCVADENAAAEVTAAMLPLRAIKAKAAVILGGHLNKSDSSQARGTRGSGALPAQVDTILELRRKGDDIEETKRELTALGRHSPPAKLTFDFDPQIGYQVVETMEEARENKRREHEEREARKNAFDDAAVQQAIRDCDRTEKPATAKAIEEATNPKLSRNRVARSLHRLLLEKLVRTEKLPPMKGRFKEDEIYILTTDLTGVLS
jgi:hypothetical protein